MLRRSLLAVGVLVMMAAPAAAGGGGCHSPHTDSITTTVEMSYFCFSPTVVRVAEGETVTWENLDSVDHNVYSSAFGTETLRGGMSGSVTFDDAGVFPYVCIFHPGMMGTVVVGHGETTPSAAIEPVAVEITKDPGREAASASEDLVEQRLAAVEASLLALPADSPGQQSSSQGLAVGLLAGLALGVLGSRLLASDR